MQPVIDLRRSGQSWPSSMLGPSWHCITLHGNGLSVFTLLRNAASHCYYYCEYYIPDDVAQPSSRIPPFPCSIVGQSLYSIGRRVFITSSPPPKPTIQSHLPRTSPPRQQPPPQSPTCAIWDSIDKLATADCIALRTNMGRVCYFLAFLAYRVRLPPLKYSVATL